MPAKTPQEKLNAAVAMYLNHPNGKDVSAATGVALTVLYRELSRLGVDKGALRLKAGKRHWNQALTEDRRLEMAKRYGAGENATALATEYGVSRTTVITAAKSLGVAICPRGQQPLKVTPEILHKIQQLWSQGHTQTFIAKHVGLNQGTVSAWLRSGRIEVGSRGVRKSPLSYKSSGGRFLSGEGYALVHKERLPAWLASMANSKGYIPEHRAVMAQMLGRMLTPHETVHHIDGDKLNNKPTNLQLRQGRHGKGVVLRCACCGSTDIRAEEIA
jgi:hypothetical protein